MATNDDSGTPGGVRATRSAAGGVPEAGGTAGPAGVPAAEPQAAGLTNTRTSHTWVAVSAGLFFLVVVLVFILQNLHSVRAHFFWATWSIPLAVDLLLAAVLGGLIVFAAGSLRIVQLRRAARRAPRR